MTKKLKGSEAESRPQAQRQDPNLSRGALLAKLIAIGADVTGRDPLAGLDLPTCLAVRDVDGTFHCLQANDRYLSLAQRLSQLAPEWAATSGLFQLVTDFIAMNAPNGRAATETLFVGNLPNKLALAVCILPMRALADGSQHFLVTVSESLLPPPAVRDGHATAPNGVVHGMRALSVAQHKSDPYTVAHQLHTANLAFWIAVELGMKGQELTELELGASLHDIGKIAVPVALLVKPATLTNEELNLVRTHARVGDEIVAELNAPSMVRAIVRNHHECLDGTGYPDGLAGDAISLPVRITSVADALEAMTTPRPYRQSYSLDRAFSELHRSSGRHHDGEVVKAAEAVVAKAPHLLDTSQNLHPQDLGKSK